MKLKPKQMESLCEGLVEESRRSGTAVRDLAQRMCALPELHGVTVTEVMRGVGDLRRAERRREFGRELSVDPATLAGVTCETETPDGSGERVAWILELLHYLGQDLVQSKPVWREVSYTLREGETAEYCRGGTGGGWLRCAVRIWHGGEVVRTFQETRITGHKPAGWNSTRGETLRMKRLTLDCDKLDTERILTRFAAVMQMYLPASRLKNAAHVARLTGRTRAAGAAQRAGLVTDYYKRTDGAAGFAGVSSARRLKERAKKANQPNQEKP